MQGTTITRFGRVLAHLVTHPHHLPFYLSRGSLTRQTPLDPASDFQTSAYLHSIPDRAFDIIVIDDSWRYPELRRNHHARSTRTFRGIGPCRAGVTTTDLYFY